MSQAKVSFSPSEITANKAFLCKSGPLLKSMASPAPVCESSTDKSMEPNATSAKLKFPSKLKKTRRSYKRKYKMNKTKSSMNKLSIVGQNVFGALSKQNSLSNVINVLSPSIINLQETKVRKAGMLNFTGYQTIKLLKMFGVINWVEDFLLQLI